MYCVDETVLHWRDPPPGPSLTPGEPRPRNHSDTLTLITCTNMDATHKLSLNIVGRYPEPGQEIGTAGQEIGTAGQEIGTAGQEIGTAGQEGGIAGNTADTAPEDPDLGDEGKHLDSKEGDDSETVQAGDSEESPSSESLTEESKSAGKQKAKDSTSILLYRKAASHELTTDIFTEWFYSTFVPQVQASLAKRDLPKRAVLILDNSLYHSGSLSDAEGVIKTVKVPCYVANRSLPSATISKSLKARYKTRIAREWSEDSQICKDLPLRRLVS